MTKRLAYALVISLAAAPVAAQPDEAGTQNPKKMTPAPFPKEDFSPDLLETIPKPFVFDLDLDLESMKAMKLATQGLADSPMVHQAKAMAEAFAYESRQDRGRDPSTGSRSSRATSRDEREAERQEREREREADLYSQGWDAAGDYRWDRALTYFNRVAELKGSKLDAALYWKAYSQNRLGQRAEALATLADLMKNHPYCTYRKPATVLEAEVRREVGQPVRPQDSTDDEVKLLALQALQNTAPEEAIPMIEKVLEGTAGPRVKQRAMFVLAQSRSPRAREVMRNYAKGGSTPELQSQAIQYLGVHGGPESRALLAEVYAGSSDVDVKRRILRAFMIAGEKDRVLKAAQGEQNPELRAEAVNQLGVMGAHEELWQLYQKETAVDVKRRIIRAMHVGGSVDRLLGLAKSEQNPELRREVIRALGLTGGAKTGDALVQIYNGDTNVDVRKAAVNALFLQQNATALVALARKEQDNTMKKEIVEKLAHMRSKVATDYMVELLGK
ncbi:MAG: HEAT repeat domain-containing protein [Vicinamibacterales bacterium]